VYSNASICKYLGKLDTRSINAVRCPDLNSTEQMLAKQYKDGIDNYDTHEL
jgi:hypothetical protein